MKVLSVVGARPQFVKAAVLSREFASADEMTEVMIHTGQHFDREMSEIFFEELAIPHPAYNLGIGAQSHGKMTGRMIEAIEAVVLEELPDVVLVYGDTNSTLAGALAAVKLRAPVAHVEAGLRSFNRAMPEEINRILVDHASDILFCPTSTAMENLRHEGIGDRAYNVGDVMYDAARYASDRAGNSSDILAALGIQDVPFGIATVHRQENVDSPERLAEIIRYLSNEAKDRDIVFPVHPRTRKALKRSGCSCSRLRLCEPLGYLDMVRLLEGAECVYTDSGGLQKEAYFFRTPCVTLRNESEWVETLDAGWNRLWRQPEYKVPRRTIEEYGDGSAGKKIVSLLRDRRQIG
jgi:UDP-GlcNAc3NAcA epimerase